MAWRLKLSSTLLDGPSVCALSSNGWKLYRIYVKPKLITAFNQVHDFVIIQTIQLINGHVTTHETNIRLNTNTDKLYAYELDDNLLIVGLLNQHHCSFTQYRIELNASDVLWELRRRITFAEDEPFSIPSLGTKELGYIGFATYSSILRIVRYYFIASDPMYAHQFKEFTLGDSICNLDSSIRSDYDQTSALMYEIQAEGVETTFKTNGQYMTGKLTYNKLTNSFEPKIEKVDWVKEYRESWQVQNLIGSSMSVCSACQLKLAVWQSMETTTTGNFVTGVVDRSSSHEWTVISVKHATKKQHLQAFKLMPFVFLALLPYYPAVYAIKYAFRFFGERATPFLKPAFCYLDLLSTFLNEYLSLIGAQQYCILLKDLSSNKNIIARGFPQRFYNCKWSLNVDAQGHAVVCQFAPENDQIIVKRLNNPLVVRSLQEVSASTKMPSNVRYLLPKHLRDFPLPYKKPPTWTFASIPNHL
ncbi:hypothetical protein M3Y95_00636800 [Aphelenchoides besseyi]|nr:hypothetical protein M3Y95_00636800 [Aphelenchoides besseyi]